METQIPLPTSLQNGCGRWFSYQLWWPEKVFINTNNTNQHPLPLNVLHLCCGAAMASAGQRRTSEYLLRNKPLQGLVLWPSLVWLGRMAVKCPTGKMGWHQGKKPLSCVTGEYVALLVGTVFSEIVFIYIAKIKLETPVRWRPPSKANLLYELN